jgi:N-formylglutamate deformylase
MSLPLLVSVPHAGIEVPDIVAPYVAIDEAEIVRDGDEQAAEVYWPLEDEAAAFVTTNVARAIVDVNRAADDHGADGVVKTHSCWNVPVYEDFPPEDIIEQLLNRYYRPYHAKLTAKAGRGAVLGIDCHTMAAVGPPIGPGAGAQRPAACVSNGGGTCPQDWARSLVACLEDALGHEVSLNDPFAGGFIARSHATEMPWVQIELSRGPFLDVHQKRNAVWAALAEWCAIHGE